MLYMMDNYPDDYCYGAGFLLNEWFKQLSELMEKTFEPQA